MLCEPEYVDTSEETTPAYDDWREKYRAARESTLTSTFGIMPFEEALRQFLALTDCQRQSDAARSGAADTRSDPIQSPEWAPPSNNHPQSTSNRSPGEPSGTAISTDWRLDLVSVKQRAAELFPGGTAVPAAKPRRPAMVGKATNELASLVFDGSKSVTLIRGQLAREEVAGYLAADLLGIELLKEEALRLGESVRKAALAAKEGDAKLRNGTSALKSKLKQRAQKDPEIAADLPHKLQRLDSDLDVARSELREDDPKLYGLPDANTVVVERKPNPKPTAVLVDYSEAGDRSVAFWSNKRHPEIKEYRGRPGGGGGDPDERYWNPRKPPCVPSDERPAHLFNTRVAAEAVSAASQVESWAPPPYEDEYYMDEERYAVACVKHEHAVRRLREAFPEVDSCPVTCTARRRDTRSCPCGRGVLARWPWVVQTAQLGFCACDMASWELTCWRSDWLAVVGRDLPL